MKENLAMSEEAGIRIHPSLPYKCIIEKNKKLSIGWLHSVVVGTFALHVESPGFTAQVELQTTPRVRQALSVWGKTPHLQRSSSQGENSSIHGLGVKGGD